MFPPGRGQPILHKGGHAGHVEAHNNLGFTEGHKGNLDCAVRHFLISAEMGDKDSPVDNKLISRMHFYYGRGCNERTVMYIIPYDLVNAKHPRGRSATPIHPRPNCSILSQLTLP